MIFVAVLSGCCFFFCYVCVCVCVIDELTPIPCFVVVEGVLGELLLLRDSGGNDELRTVDDVKRHMMGLFEYEHGGKLVRQIHW